MDIIVKLSDLGIDPAPIAEDGIPEEVLTDIFNELDMEFKDRAADKECFLYEDTERDKFLFGALEPQKLTQRARGWNLEIKREFLRCVDAICKVGANGRLPDPDELRMDTPETYQMRQAAMELDNSWFENAAHAVYMNNSMGWPYFRTILEGLELNSIICHPEEYAIVTVMPKN